MVIIFILEAKINVLPSWKFATSKVMSEIWFKNYLGVQVADTKWVGVLIKRDWPWLAGIEIRWWIHEAPSRKEDSYRLPSCLFKGNSYNSP